MKHPQGPKGLDQSQFASIQRQAGFVSVQQAGKLSGLFVSITGQQHPQILNSGSNARIVQVHDVDASFGTPKEVAGVTVAMQPKNLSIRGGQADCVLLDRLKYVGADTCPGCFQFRWEPAVAQQGFTAGVAQALHGQGRTCRKALLGADAVQSSEQTTQCFQRVEVFKFGASATSVGCEGPKKTRMLVERVPAEGERGHHRHLFVGKLQGKSVFFTDLGLGPAPGSIKLDHHLSVALPGLRQMGPIDPVLEAVEGLQAAVALQTEGLQRVQDKVGGEPRERVGGDLGRRRSK